ncbi:transmembrane protein 71 isoform X2 [Lepus europaeus]|uniref:transmembrane protein 71 isoform X2 n=1 Tax=Lepus europaeus TaxID=9983 RepID=UPI002B45D7C7|nr:transmembrane protein 71 isoform X2 [Lepus europaeus]
MHRVTHLMSTPAASKSSAGPSESETEFAGELPPTCISPSLSCDFLDGESSFECCSIDLPTGSYYTCRRSPRLLTNGYYIWTEDSFHSDKDGNITLSPSQTSVMYKENLVRIFRKKRKFRRSLSSLFDLSASESWLQASIFDADSSLREDKWLEGGRKLDTYHCGQNGDDFDFSSLADDWEPKKLNAESAKGCSSGHTGSQPARENSQDGTLRCQLTASGYFQDSTLDHSRTGVNLCQFGEDLGFLPEPT